MSSGGYLKHLSFNQEDSCVAIATRQGFKIFNCESGTCVFEQNAGSMRIVEIALRTSLVALVGAGEEPTLSPRRLRLLNTTSGSEAGSASATDINFVTSICGVRMNHERLVVLLERKTFIHNLTDLQLLESLETCPNPTGVCALSLGPERCHLALPASSTTGAVLVYDALNLHALCQIEAHLSPVSVLAFSRDGHLLASASEKGTVIRVHLVPQAQKLYTLRRGTYPAQLHSLSFSPPPLPPLLACSSATGTVHIFRLPSRGSSGRRGWVEGGAAGLVASLMPRVADIVESDRCFCSVRNASPPGVRSLCALSAFSVDKGEAGDDLPTVQLDRVRLWVVTESGRFSEYSVAVTPEGAERKEDGAVRVERECALIHSESEAISAHFV